MANITIFYKDNVISEIEESSNIILNTKGKYCEDNISLIYQQLNEIILSVENQIVNVELKDKVTGEEILADMFIINNTLLKINLKDYYNNIIIIIITIYDENNDLLYLKNIEVDNSYISQPPIFII